MGRNYLLWLMVALSFSSLACKQTKQKQGPQKPAARQADPPAAGPTYPDTRVPPGGTTDPYQPAPSGYDRQPGPDVQGQLQLPNVPIAVLVRQGFNNGSAAVNGDTIYIRQGRTVELDFAVIPQNLDPNQLNQQGNQGQGGLLGQDRLGSFQGRYNWQFENDPNLRQQVINNRGRTGRLRIFGDNRDNRDNFRDGNRNNFNDPNLNGGLGTGRGTLIIRANPENLNDGGQVTATFNIELVNENARQLGQQSNIQINGSNGGFSNGGFNNGGFNNNFNNDQFDDDDRFNGRNNGGSFDGGNGFDDGGNFGGGGFLGNIGSSLLDLILGLFQ